MILNFFIRIDIGLAVTLVNYEDLAGAQSLKELLSPHALPLPWELKGLSLLTFSVSFQWPPLTCPLETHFPKSGYKKIHVSQVLLL